MYCSGAGSDAEATTTMRVLHRAGLLEPLHHGGDGRALLADGDVDADDAGALLIDDRVDRDGGLAGAAVADDQLALAAADRDHRVDRLDAGLERLLHRLPDDDARRDHLDLAARHARDDRPRPSTGSPSASTTRPSIAGPDRHLEQAAGAADLVAFLELEVVAHDDGADVVLLQVERQAGDRLAGLRGRELEHLARHRRLEAVDAGDAVPHLEHGADFRDVGRGEVGGLDLAEQDVLDLAGTEDGFSGHE